jgi:hypothetical protein
MATICELVARGELSKFDPGLRDHQMVERLFYATPRLQKWLQNELPALSPQWTTELSPLEQVDAALNVFCSGGELAIGHAMRNMLPVQNGVWELKTPDVRLFGWFHRKDCFIGHVGDDKAKILKFSLATPYVREVAKYRHALDLNEPKFVSGENPNDVVSNYHYPD